MDKKLIKELLNNLCADEIELLIKIITTDYKNIEYDKNSNHEILNRINIKSCPYCDSTHISKNGKTKKMFKSSFVLIVKNLFVQPRKQYYFILKKLISTGKHLLIVNYINIL